MFLRTTRIRIRIRMDLHSCSKLDPYPHSLQKLDPDPYPHKIDADPKHCSWRKYFNFWKTDPRIRILIEFHGCSQMG
jgi:hypothetical protein